MASLAVSLVHDNTHNISNDERYLREYLGMFLYYLSVLASKV